MMFAIPYSVASGVGFATGFVICVMMVQSNVSVPWLTVGATLIAVVLTGLFGAVAVSSLGTRAALREAE